MNQNKLLIYNTIIDEQAQKKFVADIKRIMPKGQRYDFLYLSQEIPDLQDYTHLLLSGSELSAAAGSCWDDKILQMIKLFAVANKPILGICHGHQMMALAWGAQCRKTAIPEFSWRRFPIQPNQLFQGLENPIFLESHYDEVYDLTEDFIVLASSPECAVQAFQIKQKPIWGVQFHPEVGLDSGNKMIEDHLAKNQQDKQFYRNDLQEPEELMQNSRIFSNFLEA